MMSPNDIDILIHYHCSSKLHEWHDMPAVQESTEMFVNDGILQWDNDTYRTTEMGRAWLKMIIKTPYPRQAWVDEEGNEIKC
jgi:hypothetical protein